MKFICEKCGNTFEGKGKRLKHAWCPSCASKYYVKLYLERYSGKCKLCDKQLHKIGAVYCQDCYRKYKLWKFPRGEKHPKWTGGRRKSSGYILVYNGSRDNYIGEHRLVWEQTHGRKLPKDWIVHHINGVKDDNRPENLEAMPRNKHSAWFLLQAAQKRIRELEQLRLPSIDFSDVVQ